MSSLFYVGTTRLQNCYCGLNSGYSVDTRTYRSNLDYNCELGYREDKAYAGFLIDQRLLHGVGRVGLLLRSTSMRYFNDIIIIFSIGVIMLGSTLILYAAFHPEVVPRLFPFINLPTLSADQS